MNEKKNGMNKKKKKKGKQIPHVYLFPVVFVYFELLLRVFTKTGLFAHILFPILFGIAAGFFWSAVTSCFPRKVNRWIAIVLLFGVALLFIVECLIKRSFQFYLPLNGISGTAGDVAGSYLKETLRAILFGIPAIILYFAPGILYVLYGKRYIPARRYRKKSIVKLLGYSLVLMLVTVVFASFGNAGLKYKKQYKFDTATEYFGLITSLRLDLKYSIFGNKSTDSFAVEEMPEEAVAVVTPEVPVEIIYEDNIMDLPLEQIDAETSSEDVKKLNEYVSGQTPTKQNEYTGLFKGKNLILICAEALSDVVIDAQLTPTLYRMTHNGFYFSEYYHPSWGGSTTSGEYAYFTGLVPLYTDQSMVMVQNHNLYFTLGNQLKREGYFSRAYHNGNYDYYSRELTHENLGYDQYLALGNGLEEITGWWPDDQRMIDKTLEQYIDQQPFSVYYMTISGHCVYTSDHEHTVENESYVRSIVGDRYKDTTVYYLCYQMELEQAMTSLIEKLEAAGIADDTVICMTSDHYPYGLEDTETFGNSDDYVADLYGYAYSNAWEKDHNSWIIWSGCLEKENKDLVCEIAQPTYCLDILPTMSNLFGLTYDSRLLVGRDVFSDAEPLVIWNTYSWVSDKGKYDSATGTFYPNDGVTVDDAYVDRMNTIVANKISYSDKVVQTDYYRVLFGD